MSVLARADRAVVRRFVKPVEEVETDAGGVAVAIQGEPVHEVAGGLPCLAAARVVAVLPGAPHRRVGRPRTDSRPATCCSSARWSTPGSGSRPTATRTHREILRMEDTRMNYGG